MKIAYYGHSSFAAEINGKHLLFDPFITQNPLAEAVDIRKIKADYIFVSHAHFDHITNAAAIADQTGATVISNFEVISWLSKNGVKNTRPLNPGGTYSSDFGRAKCVNAIHSSSLPDGTYGGSAGGFVVESADANFYYSGDTALLLDMKLISETTKLKFAVLCIGGNLTMDIPVASQFGQTPKPRHGFFEISPFYLHKGTGDYVWRLDGCVWNSRLRPLRLKPRRFALNVCTISHE
jgi:L-ascorbate metabolism protein UlaG (beta-lactamase superfamily)